MILERLAKDSCLPCRIRPLDMNMEEAMRFTLTAGVTGTPRQ